MYQRWAVILTGIVGFMMFTHAAYGQTVAQNIAVMPKRVESDTNGDGVLDRWEFYEEGEIVRAETDRDFDGIVDEWLYFEGGQIMKGERDMDGDGKPDTWLYY